MDYDNGLKDTFGHLEILVVKHDTSYGGLPLYVECTLGSKPKDKGTTALDFQNYLYRTFGFSFQTCPEYRGRGKTSTIRVFLDWNQAIPLIKSICASLNKPYKDNHLPYEFSTARIQSPKAAA